MVMKIAVVAALAFVAILHVEAAPSAGKSIATMSDNELIEKFMQFVNEDKQIAVLLEHYKEQGDHMLRKRQVENLNDNDMATAQPDGGEGFFDRAAKFVMEIVQRFLKWINTD